MSDEKSEKTLPDTVEKQIADITNNEGKDFFTAMAKTSQFMFGPELHKTKKEIIDLVNEKLRVLSQEKDAKVDAAKTLVINKSSKGVEDVRQEMVKLVDDRVKNLEARITSKISSERVETVKEIRTLLDGMEIKITSANVTGTLSLPEATETSQPKK